MYIHTPPSLIWMFSAKPRTGTIEEGRAASKSPH